MTTLAATATPLLSYAVLGAGLALLVVGWLAFCWLWPFAYCRRCKGLGRRKAPLGRAFRLCPRCDGTGRRLRIGRHVINHLRRAHRDGTR